MAPNIMLGLEYTFISNTVKMKDEVTVENPDSTADNKNIIQGVGTLAAWELARTKGGTQSTNASGNADKFQVEVPVDVGGHNFSVVVGYRL